MEIFYKTLEQMLLMFVLMLTGFILRKKSILPDNSNITMSKMETFIFVPAMNLFIQMSKCTIKTFTENWVLILYGFVTVLCAMALAYPVSRLFVKDPDSYQRNVYKYALTFGNYGFMGNFIVQGVWGDDVLAEYLLFTFGVGIFCSSWGLYILIPKDKSDGLAANLKKGLLTPPMISLFLGIAIGLSGLTRFIPTFFMNALQSASNCQGPVAMVLAGFVVGGYNFRELLTNKGVYVATALRLIVIPGALMLILKALAPYLGTTEQIMTLALITYATPLGLNTIVYPSAYGGETKTGASMAMISHTLSVITIPLMYLVFIVLL